MRALLSVEEGWHAEDALARGLPEGPDGRLAWHDVFGVLRHRSVLDAALRPHLRQPLATLDAPVRAVLRVGAFEKLFSRTPDHAVVQQMVEVARRTGAGRASGLVNAVLRRVAMPTGLSRAESLDHPAWLVARWDQRYGAEATDAWCARNNTIAPICLVTRDPEALDARLESAAPEAMLEGMALPGTRVVPAGADLPGVEDGLAWVQDPSSVKVADLLADAVGSGWVLDACAAPGGKSARLWARGLDVTATDLEERLLPLGANMERITSGSEGPAVDVQAWDWTQGTPAELGSFDGVLVDAPCTGLGTLRRHPEIRWRRTVDDIRSSAERQLAILNAAAQSVKPGGVLVYAVCSPEPEEGSEVVSRFLERAPEFLRELDWSSAPPSGEEDAHQAFVMRRNA
ncbi:MAG: transcription antitermination factor NusB [Myxococcota bacterium]